VNLPLPQGSVPVMATYPVVRAATPVAPRPLIAGFPGTGPVANHLSPPSIGSSVGRFSACPVSRKSAGRSITTSDLVTSYG